MLRMLALVGSGELAMRGYDLRSQRVGFPEAIIQFKRNESGAGLDIQLDVAAARGL